ncbi:MAG: RdgB/HAM1 family non-canonical purine NTP pyrophosphatase [Candidatus Bipolaricaulota bacterium]|nr:RdgB/HAM1 family non-canonical purine NTP pyrophosphatase [Candidatus Bipolaricaulota bacterium]
MSEFKLLLGTKNPGKVKEAKRILSSVGKGLEIISFHDRDFPEVEETGETYLENSLKKAREISRNTGLPVISDDSGLEVVALNGAPGPRSARFAGPDSSDEENLKLLLDKLKGVNNRQARFVTIATLYISPNERYVSRGVLEGRIIREPKGSSGFGYDPVFVPEGYERTLAELGEEEKNKISHRKKALEKMKSEILGIIWERKR